MSAGVGAGFAAKAINPLGAKDRNAAFHYGVGVGRGEIPIDAVGVGSGEMLARDVGVGNGEIIVGGIVAVGT